MRKSLFLLTIFCIALLAVNATATTDNKDLPTKKEVKRFVNAFESDDDFISEISDAAKEEHPTWKWDIWNDGEMISFYYKTSNGYGSIYYDEDGDRVKPDCDVKYEATESYLGGE
jgi:hypothetical protein